MDLGFPGSSAGKESACNAGDLGSILGLGRSPREGKGCTLQYSGLENSRDCIVSEVAKSLSEFHGIEDPLVFFFVDHEEKTGGRITTEPVPGLSGSRTHFLSLTRAMRTYFSPFLVSSLINY